ncbi:MAG: hypothetical protein LUC91_05760, partial [Prevotella sp.]|nr:hypothetical protein [Prevotella sp.]
SLCLCLLMVNVTIHANAQNQCNHIIIAFDRATPRYRAYYNSPKILNTIDSILIKHDWIRDNNYLSIVGYAMESYPSIERFVRPYQDSHNKDVIWVPLKGLKVRELFNNWPNGEPQLIGSDAYSMQSHAKPYCVMETKNRPDAIPCADRTILMLVSDDIINGTEDDFKSEWNQVQSTLSVYVNYNTNRSPYWIFKEMAEGVKNTIGKFNEEYRFVQLVGDPIYISEDKRYKITTYDVLACEQPSVYSTTDFPSRLSFKRIRGHYKLNFKVHPLNPDRYQIKSIELITPSIFFEGGDEGIIVTYCANEVNGTNGDEWSFDMAIPSEEISQGDSVEVSMSLALKDGLYNGYLISPINDKGMSVTQVVELQDEVKVLGIWSLSDAYWWWFPNDLIAAVVLWDLIILLIGIIILGILVIRIFVWVNGYKPENKDIKITKL